MEAREFWSFVDRASTRLADQGDATDPTATRLLLTLNRASAVITYDLESSIHRPRGRSWAAFRLMFVLWLAGPLESKRAAELTGQSRAATSNLTTPLEAAGVLTRKTDNHDRRSVTLTLTEAGRAEITELFAEHHRREQQWAQALTPWERETLTGLLEKLIMRTDITIRGRT
ncbi:MarR family transcriptional regulator [Enemella dayhoffiae]|uniref:MarR family transcriptional regulator n=1 Tax=Enemella dayhoffiae TaxID=2016507 RepID=A0A255HFP2_9ACTN|nr:MarR family winged helix-turn-helix transcriptional regulator [Enemella dayhoffiae]OYO25284.1 MarR family transcriptional regulator [Enemella dayhoffiae]